MKNIYARNIGLITGGLMIAATLFMFYVLHLPEAGTAKYVCYGIYSAGILLSLFNYYGKKNVEKNTKSFFSEGFKTFVVVVFLMAVFGLIFYKLNPQIFDARLAEINAINSQDPNKTAAEVTENSNKLKNIFIPMTVAINTVLYLILGALISIIASAFLANKIQTSE